MKKTMIQFCGACAVVAATMFAVACASNDANMSSPSDSGGGKGGSMARFTIVGDWLYTVDHNSLRAVSLADPARPTDADPIYLWNGDVETIFAMDTLLFIGSQSAMYIYDIRKPEFPEFLSQSTHFKSCDPVVAADTLAFVTLNGSLGNWCGNRGDALWVYDISDVKNPVVLDEVGLTSPRGLAVDIDAKIVFVCADGIKAYDITDPRNIEPLYSSISVPEVGRADAYDCILHDGRLIVIGGAGLYQMSYDREGFTFISKIDLRPQR